jgi:murein DD-endopeptidase MepM/ murein hydrolase activator NlpD
MQGTCNFEDTWHAPRGGGRLHLGVDIIAPEGRLIYAVTDGTITKTYSSATDKLAGNGVRLTMPDGTYFFYGHFQRIADGITVGSKVKAGQVIGYNGKSGATNTPHLHFEVHPRGGEAINPYPIVKAVDACNVTAPLPVPAP